MPIKPENKSRYPKNWKEIRERILKRANNRCEFCGVENHTYRHNPKTGKDAYIVLTIAHLDHTPENCSDDNLKASDHDTSPIQQKLPFFFDFNHPNG